MEDGKKGNARSHESGACGPMRSRSLLTNSLWNYLGAGFSVVVTVVTTPIYLNVLGLERYGVLAVLSALLAPMGVLNAGVTQATVKFVATYVTANDADAARDVVSASLLINIVVGFAGAAVCYFGAPYFLSFGFKISPDLCVDAETSLRLMGGVWFVTQIGGNFRGVLEGLRDQRSVVIGDAMGILFTAGLCTAGALFSGRLSWFVGGQFVAGLLLMVYWQFHASLALGGWRFGWVSAKRHVKRVYGYSIWQVLNAFVAVIANVGDRYFIGIYLSASTLGAYNVALRVQSVARTLFYSVNQALFPAASAIALQPGASERLTVTTTWNVSLLAGLGLGWLTVCGPALLELWVGRDIASGMGFPLRILLITLLFEIPSATGSSYLNAHARTRLTAFNNIATTVLTIGLMIPLGIWFEVKGVAFAALLGLALTRAPFHLWLYGRYFGSYVSRRTYINAFYGVGTMVIIAVIPTLWIFDVIWTTLHGVTGFICAGATSGGVLMAFVLTLIIFVLRDQSRLRDLLMALSAREIPFISQSSSYIAGKLAY